MKNKKKTQEGIVDRLMSVLLALFLFSLAAIVMISIWNDRIFVFGTDRFGILLSLGIALPSMMFLIFEAIKYLGVEQK